MMEIRRSDLDAQRQIEDMIKDEGDPRARAQLLILYQLSSNQTDSISIVRSLVEELKALRQEHEQHVKEEEELIQQGRGAWKAISSAWKILSIILIAAQSALGYLYVQHLNALEAVQNDLIQAQQDIEIIKERHRVENRSVP
jgi:hypothetical protein